MFYSQFILAKKGPLGTIWIAAHLERKLRKNQVADTDIGVSVDSILFPEVPIALRLSSHLLLGVVRIYSRKVNYLFDDCSEALLKIKQAFRSTAVDLPPEESTAPYHSITLPETFDLDDFELPDNDIFHGNYVDHHVSTREQITLQDTMDGVVYSTSQFGLDERFGDGDASQIGLDLDEELLLEKVTAAAHGGISNVDPQGSVKPMTPFEEDSNSERINETSETTAVNNSANQHERLGVNAEFVEYAEAPSTPGLVQEPNLSCVQEALACDDHMESEDHNSNELVAAVSTVKALRNSDFHRGDDNAMDCSLHNDSNYDNVQGMLPEENGYHVREKEVEQVKLLGDSVNSVPFVSDHSEGTIGALDGSERIENIQNAVVSENVPGMLSVETQGVRSDRTAASPSCSHVTSDLQDPSCKTGIVNEPVSEGYSVDNRASMRTKIGGDAEITDNLPQSNLPAMFDLESHTCQEDQDPMNSNLPIVHEETPCIVTNVLKPCSSHPIQPDKSSFGQENVMAPNLQYEEVRPHSLQPFRRDGASLEVQGEECCYTDIMQSDKNQVSGPSVPGEIHADGKKSDELLDNAISSDQLENVNNSMRSELLAPEKLLSVPEVPLDKPNDFLVDSTPDKEVLPRNGGVDAGNKLISGKKRSYTESTLTVESLNSSESFGVAKSKKASESVPDDDDLLSSILVGRRSSVFKLKPTPPVPEVASRKRARAASQTSALKRKVLMDDTMVLHGDIIRQQLTNTEDIRRIRKKAPCTCPEILMIQIQFLEDEIFSETIFTGMSAELMSLHRERHDLSRIKVSQTDENYGSPEVAKSTGESGEEGTKETVVLGYSGEAQPASTPIQTESWQCSEHLLGPHDTDAQGCGNAITDVAELETMHNELLSKVSEMNIGGIEVAEGKANGGDASLQIDVSSMTLEQQLDAQPVEEVASLTDISNGKGVGVESELKPQDELLLEEGKVGASLENRADDQKYFTAPTDNANTCEASSLETGGNWASENGDHNNLGAVNEDGVLSGLGCDGNDNSISNLVPGEEPIIDTTNSVENDIGLKNATLNDGGNPILLDADLQCATDAEITSFDHPDAENRGEFEDIEVGNDTEFLNVDDDEVAEDYDGGNGHAEDTRLLDNSGWSSRTRAVAKYLQTLFDRETLHGKKVLALDHLLSGKTRKEASRMFFETLVLKTKDYIFVEQAKPLDNISIKPRAKLIKSDF